MRHTPRSGLSASSARSAGGVLVKSHVSIADSRELARQEQGTAAPGDPYGELMANYVEWGELLEAWSHGTLEMSDEEFEEQCLEHLERSEVLGQACARYNAQCWAVLFNAIRTDEVA